MKISENNKSKLYLLILLLDLIVLTELMRERDRDEHSAAA